MTRAVIIVVVMEAGSRVYCVDQGHVGSDVVFGIMVAMVMAVFDKLSGELVASHPAPRRGGTGVLFYYFCPPISLFFLTCMTSGFFSFLFLL